MSQKYVVQYPDERYYREGKEPRHFMHNATKMSLRKATQVADSADGGAIIIPVPEASMPLGC